MQQIRFERERMNNYMVIDCEEWLERTAYANKLLESTRVEGFMNYEIRELDGKQSIYYELNYKTSLKQVLGDLQFDYEKVENIVRSIVSVLEKTEEYLLCTDCILWNSDCIFIEVTTGNLMFTYYPVVDKQHNSLKKLLTELLQYIDKQDQEVYMYWMGFYNTVTNVDNTIESMRMYIKNHMRAHREIPLLQEPYIQEEVSSVKKHTGFVPIIILSLVNFAVLVLLLIGVWTYQYVWVLVVTLFLLFVAILVKVPSEKEDDPDRIMEDYKRIYLDSTKQTEEEIVSFENTGIYPSIKDSWETIKGQETTILTMDRTDIVIEEQPKVWCFKSMKPKAYPDIEFGKTNIVIGTMRNGCNYILKENGISRMHAKILQKDDGLYLLDMNSTNGTFLNEERLIGGTEYLLNEGDVISLAQIVQFVVVWKE